MGWRGHHYGPRPSPLQLGKWIHVTTNPPYPSLPKGEVKFIPMQKASTKPRKPSINRENRAWMGLKHCLGLGWLCTHGWTSPFRQSFASMRQWASLSSWWGLLCSTLTWAIHMQGWIVPYRKHKAFLRLNKFSESLLLVTQMWIHFSPVRQNAAWPLLNK